MDKYPAMHYLVGLAAVAVLILFLFSLRELWIFGTKPCGDTEYLHTLKYGDIAIGHPFLPQVLDPHSPFLKILFKYLPFELLFFLLKIVEFLAVFYGIKLVVKSTKKAMILFPLVLLPTYSVMAMTPALQFHPTVTAWAFLFLSLASFYAEYYTLAYLSFFIALFFHWILLPVYGLSILAIGLSKKRVKEALLLFLLSAAISAFYFFSPQIFPAVRVLQLLYELEKKKANFVWFLRSQLTFDRLWRFFNPLYFATIVLALRRDKTIKYLLGVWALFYLYPTVALISVKFFGLYLPVPGRSINMAMLPFLFSFVLAVQKVQGAFPDILLLLYLYFFLNLAFLGYRTLETYRVEKESCFECWKAVSGIGCNTPVFLYNSFPLRRLYLVCNGSYNNLAAKLNATTLEEILLKLNSNATFARDFIESNSIRLIQISNDTVADELISLGLLRPFYPECGPSVYAVRR